MEMAPGESHDRILRLTEAHVREALEGDGSGHDWWHIERVRRLALRLGAGEGADLLVVELAALLHDLADWKFHGGDETAAPRAAAAWLEGLGASADVVDHVREIVGGLSFRGAGVPTQMRTLEGRVVQDADRLDAIGAIGIARAFAFGGHRGRALHDPGVPSVPHDTFEAYKSKTGPTTNHFHEKLFLLRDRMNTEAAKQLAADRHRFMEDFLRCFLAEWEGDR